MYNQADDFIQINFNGFQDDEEYIDLYEMMTEYRKIKVK